MCKVLRYWRVYFYSLTDQFVCVCEYVHVCLRRCLGIQACTNLIASRRLSDIGDVLASSRPRVGTLHGHVNMKKKHGILFWSW